MGFAESREYERTAHNTTQGMAMKGSPVAISERWPLSGEQGKGQRAFRGP